MRKRDGSECFHLNFFANADVNRLFAKEPADATKAMPTNYTVDLTIKCEDCGEAFTFVGMPRGSSASQPMMSFTGNEARLPICPISENPDVSMPGFVISGGGVGSRRNRH